MFLYCFYFCSQFGEDVSVAPSVALVSERNANQSTPSPQVYPSVSGDQDPAAALWGNQEYTKARWKTFLNVKFLFLNSSNMLLHTF